MKRLTLHIFIFRIMVLAGMLLTSTISLAQSAGFKTYDSLTLALYNSGDWKKLSKTGDSAIKSGYDFYYMQMRTGIAYYQLRKYRKAEKYFQKALTFSTGDQDASQYLYYSYLLGGSSEKADAMDYSGTPNPVDSVVKAPFKFIYLESGYTSANVSQTKPAQIMGDSMVYGEHEVYKDVFYYHAGTKIKILPRVGAYISGSMLQINRQKQFAFNLYNESVNEVLTYDTTFSYNFAQKDVYGSVNFLTANGVLVIPAFHFSWGNPMSISGVYNGTNYLFMQSQYNYLHYAFSVMLLKNTGNFALSVQGSAAKLSATGNQIQSSVSATWFPLGNLNVYTTATLTALRYNGNNQLIADGNIGIKLLPFIWLEAIVTRGNMQYSTEKNAFIVYNMAENIVMRSGANIIIPVNKHIEISLMYRYFKREYENLFLSGLSATKLTTSVFQYNNQSVYGGVKWNF